MSEAATGTALFALACCAHLLAQCRRVPAPVVRRVWMDGVFDLTHFGHMNAFRLARSLGTHLVVGINSDASTAECKGAPVMTEEERADAVRGCRWVDEVVTGVPYVMDPEYLARTIRERAIDVVVHGDDLCAVDGIDVYASAKQIGALPFPSVLFSSVLFRAGKYRSIPRTEGVSTTQLIGRLLRCHDRAPSTSPTPGAPPADSYRAQSSFLVTSSLLHAFLPVPLTPVTPIAPLRAVYIAGVWDALEGQLSDIFVSARALGDCLIVGVLGEAEAGPAVLTMLERALTAAGARGCDQLLLDAPSLVTQGMVDVLALHTVALLPVTLVPFEPLREKAMLFPNPYPRARVCRVRSGLRCAARCACMRCAWSRLSCAHRSWSAWRADERSCCFGASLLVSLTRVY